MVCMTHRCLEVVLSWTVLSVAVPRHIASELIAEALSSSRKDNTTVDIIGKITLPNFDRSLKKCF
eukprot:13253.XXX_737010_737204_1 [CDS] Oithona nana genome sequencing.